MKNLFNKPRMMLEADAKGGEKKPLLEILIFMLVFMVASTIQSVLVTVPMVAVILTSKEFHSIMQEAVSGGTVDLTEFSNFLMSHPAIMAITLFSTVATIATAIFYCTKIEKRPLCSLGITKRSAFSEYGIGLLVGFVIFGAVIALGVLFGGFSFSGVNDSLLGALPFIAVIFLGYMVQGASEEILCRGYFCVSLARRAPVYLAVIVNSAVFALLHISNPGISPLAIVNLTLFGVFASVYMMRRGNIWGICAIHSMWNFAQGSIFGLQVSGLETSSSIFFFSQNEGKGIITGGAFGPEGGICVTIVLVVATVIMLFMKNKDKGFEE